MQGLELILILLAVAAVLQLVSDRFSIPHPALLVLGGLVIAVTPGLPHLEVNPEVIFLIFIPPLLYRAALSTSLRDVRRNWHSISLLAVGLVLLTMCAAACAAHWLIPEMTWGSAFVLGAIVSPPDAVAVVAVTRRLGLPKDIEIILQGESLLNDATAFVAYRMAVAAVVTGAFSLWHSGFRFLWTGLGAIALGYIVAWLIGRLRRLIGQAIVVENTISLLTPFAAFIPAERLGLASVLAVVTTGLYFGRYGPRILSAQSRLQAYAMWDMLVFVLEGLIFILVGLELPVVLKALADHSLSSLIYYTAVISLVLVIVRLAWMFPGAYLPGWFGTRSASRQACPPWRHVLFVGWAGMRGGDSLVIALALPLTIASGAPFPARDLIILLTFGVILVTLVVQGFSLKPVIHALRLRADDTDADEESYARLKTAQTGLARLNEIADIQDVSTPVIEKLRAKHEHRIHRLDTNNPTEHSRKDVTHAADYRDLRLKMIAAERAEIIRLRDGNEISDHTMQRVQQDLDLEEVQLSAADARAQTDELGD